MSTPRSAFLIGVFLFATSLRAADYVSGYGVDNHQACGNNNLSFCQKEVGGFIGGLPTWLLRNVFWANQNVKASHWKPGSDYFTSTVAKSGYDGVGAPVVAYIASHGGTSGGTYTLSFNDGSSCSVNSKQMKLGSNKLRYVFLSTCQGVKIGTGDQPTSAGENPMTTWGGAINGVRCIYGVSNNQADSADYGTKFWAKWKVQGTPTSKAWLEGVWEVNHNNVPAVICFGESAVKAQDRLEKEEQFGTGYANPAFGYWKWLKSAREERRMPSEGSLPRTVYLRGKGIDRDALAARFPGARVAGEKDGGMLPTVGKLLSVSADGYQYVDHDERGSRSNMRLSDTRIIEIAREFLRARELEGVSHFVASIRDEQVADSTQPGLRTIARTVVFKQRIFAASALGSSDEVRVTVTGRGVVSELQDLRWNLGASSNSDVLEASSMASRMPVLQAQAMEKARLTWPGSLIALEKAEVGYSPEGRIAKLTYRALLKVSLGGFDRLHEIELPL